MYILTQEDKDNIDILLPQTEHWLNRFINTSIELLEETKVNDSWALRISIESVESVIEDLTEQLKAMKAYVEET